MRATVALSKHFHDHQLPAPEVVNDGIHEIRVESEGKRRCRFARPEKSIPPTNPASMNKPIIVALVLACNGGAIAQAQTAASKPAPTDSTLPAGLQPKRVSAAEFKKEYAEVGMAQTMHSVVYLGHRDGRAYIHRRSMSSLNQKKWSDHVIFVELAELDATFRDSLPKTEIKDGPRRTNDQ
jgi:hypothetical protein